jgi:hypothetical protein
MLDPAGHFIACPLAFWLRIAQCFASLELQGKHLPATDCATRRRELKHSVPKAIDTDSAQGVSAFSIAIHRRPVHIKKNQGLPSQGDP